MRSPNKKTRSETGRALSHAEKALVADLVAEGLTIQEKFRPEPLYKLTGKGHYQADTVEDIRRAKDRARRGKKE